MLYAITRGLVSAEAACTDQIVYLVSSTQTLRKAGLTVVASNRHAELVLSATLFAHESAAFDVDVPAGVGGDLC